MINLIIKFALIGLAVFMASNMHLLPGIHVNSIETGLKVAVVLGLLNTFVKPILSLLSLPLTIITLGLFSLVINIVIIYAAAYFVDGFRVAGWLDALIFSFAISILSWFLGLFLD